MKTDNLPVIGTVTVNMPTRAALFDDLARRLEARQGFALATVNLDHVVKLRHDPDFRAGYAAQTHVVADGNPIVWVAKLAGQPVELIPGSELVHPLCALAARLGVPVAFLGSTPQVLQKAGDRLSAAHPGLQIVARIAPAQGLDPTGATADACLNELAASNDPGRIYVNRQEFEVLAK